MRDGVRVCGVNPGPVDPPVSAIFAKSKRRNRAARTRRMAPLVLPHTAYGRPARTDETSGTVASLPDRVSHISGAMVAIDGGIVARGGAPAIRSAITLMRHAAKNAAGPHFGQPPLASAGNHQAFRRDFSVGAAGTASRVSARM